jgi:hypothetical protein
MLLAGFLTLLAVAGFAVHWFLVTRVQGVLTAESLFGISQIIMLTGTWLLDFGRFGMTPDQVAPYISAMAACYAAYFLAAIYFALLNPPRPRQPITVVDRDAPIAGGTLILLVVSVAIAISYFVMIGPGALVQGLRAGLGQIELETSISQVRLNAYAGDTYRAPGFFNQFRYYLAPALLLIASDRLLRARVSMAIPFAVGSLLLGAYFLLGTGQRGGFVAFVLTAITYFSLMGGKGLHGRIWGLLVAALVFFGLASTAIGRTEAASNPLASTLGEVFQRFFSDNQASGLLGYIYVQLVPQPLLAEWYVEFLGLLPGRAPGNYRPLAGAVAEFNRNSGTMPLSNTGSAVVALGLVGALVFFFVWGVVLAKVSRAGLGSPERNRIELMGIAGTFTACGVWIAGGPTSVILYGLITYSAMWFFGRHARLRAAAEAAEPTAEPDRVLGSPTRTHAKRGPAQLPQPWR